MCRDFHQASPYRAVPFNLEKVKDLFQRYCDDLTSHICIVLQSEGEVKGVIFGLCHEVHFSNTRAATELIWWVDPDIRSSRGGLMLMDAFTEWARHVHADFISFTNTVDTTDLHRLYLRKGFKPVETTYVKEL